MNNRTPVSRVIVYLLVVMIPILGLLLLGRNFIYDSIVVPIEYELWLAGLAIRALPQPILWGILCALVMVIALTSLLAGKDAPQKAGREEPLRTRSERVAFWATQIGMATRGSYSKLRFADFFSKLILDILIYTGEVSQEQYENALKTGSMDLPPDILVYLKIRLTPFYELRSPPFIQRLVRSFRALLHPPVVSKSAKTAASQGAAFDSELERAVAYLEHELEVNTINMEIEEVNQLVEKVIHEVERAVVGKQEVLKKIMATFLATGGHVLLEDYPGLAKILIANSFASVLGLPFKRIQFTPDLLPGDITGGYIYDRSQNQFQLRKGPLFSSIILADEINRASPRTQSALLEAMQEYQVTLEGETMKLPEPFIVIATQNPIEYEGTFPLPEAQLDRFMVKLSIGYPLAAEEQEILKRRRERGSDAFNLSPVTNAEGMLAMRQAIEDVHIDPDIEQYIVQIIDATRKHKMVAVGSSPRGSLALLKLSRAWAAIHGRSYVIPDDVKAFARPVLLHRLILQPDLWTERKAPDEVVADVLRQVPVPVLGGV